MLLQKNKSRKSRLLQESTQTAKKNCKDKTGTRGHSARSLNKQPHLLTHKLSCRTEMKERMQEHLQMMQSMLNEGDTDHSKMMKMIQNPPMMQMQCMQMMQSSEKE